MWGGNSSRLFQTELLWVSARVDVNVDMDKDPSGRRTQRCGVGCHQVKLERLAPLIFLWPYSLVILAVCTPGLILQLVCSLCNSQGVIDDEEWPALGINRDNIKPGSMTAANNVSSSPRFAAGDSKPSTTSRMPHDPLLTSDVPLTTSDSLTNTNAHVSSRVAASDMSDAACDDPSPASTVTDQSSLCDNSKSDVTDLSFSDSISSQHILLVGDSMFKYLEENLVKLEHRWSSSVRFISGGKISDILQLPELEQFDVLAIHVGLNDVRSGTSAEACFDLYAALLKRLLARVPHIKIIISSVIPMAPDRHRKGYAYEKHLANVALWNSQILELNSLLVQFCASHPRMKFVDNTVKFMRNGIVQSSLLAYDGLHFNRSGIRMVAISLSKSVHSLTGAAAASTRSAAVASSRSIVVAPVSRSGAFAPPSRSDDVPTHRSGAVGPASRSGAVALDSRSADVPTSRSGAGDVPILRSNAVAPASRSDDVPTSRSSAIAFTSRSGDVALASRSGDVALASRSGAIAFTSRSGDVAPASRSDDVPTSRPCDVAPASRSGDVALASRSGAIAFTSRSGDVAPASRSGDVPTFRPSDVAPASRTGDVPTSRSSTIAFTSRSGAVAPASRSGDVPTSRPSDVAPASRPGDVALASRSGAIAFTSRSGAVAPASRSGDVPTSRPSDVAPASRSDDVPTSRSSTIAFTSRSGAVAPASRSGDVPTFRPSDVAPTSRSDDVPTFRPSDVAPASRPGDVALASRSGAVAPASRSGDVPTSRPCDVAPASRSVDVPTSRSSDVAPASRSGDVPTFRPSDVAPASRSGDVPTFRPSDVAPASRSGDVPTSRSSDVAPASRSGDVPTFRPSDVAPASRSGDVPTSRPSDVAPASRSDDVPTFRPSDVAPASRSGDVPTSKSGDIMHTSMSSTVLDPNVSTSAFPEAPMPPLTLSGLLPVDSSYQHFVPLYTYGFPVPVLLHGYFPYVEMSSESVTSPPPSVSCQGPPSHTGHPTTSMSHQGPPSHTGQPPTSVSRQGPPSHTGQPPTSVSRQGPPSHTGHTPTSVSHQGPPSHTGQPPTSVSCQGPPSHTGHPPTRVSHQGPPSQTGHPPTSVSRQCPPSHTGHPPTSVSRQGPPSHTGHPPTSVSRQGPPSHTAQPPTSMSRQGPPSLTGHPPTSVSRQGPPSHTGQPPTSVSRQGPPSHTGHPPTSVSDASRIGHPSNRVSSQRSSYTCDDKPTLQDTGHVTGLSLSYVYDITVFNRFAALEVNDTCFVTDDSVCDQVCMVQNNVVKGIQRKTKKNKGKKSNIIKAKVTADNNQVRTSKLHCVHKDCRGMTSVSQLDCKKSHVVTSSSSSHQDASETQNHILVKFCSKVLRIPLQDSKGMAVGNLLDNLSNEVHVDKKLLRASVNGSRYSDEGIISFSDSVEVVLKGIGGGRSKKSKHHEGDCTCCVCDKGNDEGSLYFYHLKDMVDSGDPESVCVADHLLQNYPPESCICYNCRRRVSHNIGSNSSPVPQSVPKKLRLSERPKCMLSDYGLCGEFGSSCSFDLATVSECFSVDFPDDTNVVLCSQHMVKVRSSDRFASCFICAKACRSQKPKFANFLNMEFLFQYLRENVDHQIKVGDNDILCDKCFCNVHFFAQGKLQCTGSTCSSQSVQNELECLLAQFSDSQVEADADDFDSCQEKAFHSALSKLLGDFLNCKACLFDEIYHIYLDVIRENYVNNLGASSIKSQEILLSDILCSLGHKLVVHRETSENLAGMVLAWADNDIVISLRKSLTDTLVTETADYVSAFAKFRIDREGSQLMTSEVPKLSGCLSVFRNKIKDMCLQLKDWKADSDSDLTNIDFIEFLRTNIDPELWNFTVLTTMSEREYSTVNKGNFNWKVPYLPDESALSGHYMQRLSLICMFAFIYSNGECNQPVTMLITDIVDKYTKSSKDCKDILNKFGVTVAPKTYEMYQKQKANDSSKNKEEELIPNSFAVCSYDNINKRSRFARVHSKDVKRGFDGTSLMICYPKPNDVMVDDDEKTSFFQQASLDMFNKPFVTVNVDESPVHSLFKSLLCLLHSKLRQCSRDDSGQPLDDIISDLEKHLSSAMQEWVLQEMQRHYTFYENVKTDYVADFLTALEGYTSTVDSGTITELICLSMLIKWPIVIHLKRSDQHDKCLSLWPDILQDRIPLNLLIEKDLFCPLIYQDAFYDTKELVTICNGKIDLSVLHSICPITVGDLYECLCDSYHNIVLDSSRYKSSSISLYSNPTIAAGVYMRPLPEQTGMIDINHQSLSLDGFGPAKCESDTAETLQSKLFCYVYGKCAFQILQSDIDDCLPGLKIFSAMQCPPTAEKSKFVYLDILDLDANCKETTLRVLSQFANVLNIGKSLKYLVVVGDALSYKQLRYLKDTRPSKFQWLLPYIGDWHTLLNYGHKLMKLYSDAGLKEFVHRCHKGATATAVLEAKSFDKMLNFLLELWEAMFRYQVILFVDSCMQDDPVLTQDISTLFLQWTKKNSVKHSWNKFANDITSLCSALEPVLARFLTFLENKSKDDETFMFWNNFIHRDCLAFIGFYLSLRSGDWDMRNFFLKEMAPFFHIVSSNYYYDLIPKHLSDLQCFPQPVINHFKQGGFVANLNGNNWSSVALDEAHEMTINREVKNAITAPTIELFQLKAHYLPYRTKLLKNLFFSVISKPWSVWSRGISQGIHECFWR